MKNTGKKSLLLLMLSSFVFLPGCEMLMLPFQFIYFILGSSLTLFFRLLPVAAKLLPLALLIVRVPDEEIKDNNIQPEMKITYNFQEKDVTPYPDACAVIQSKLDEQPDGEYIIFSFNAPVTEKEMKRIVSSQLNGKVPLSAECYMVNGASLYNDKFRFYLLLDRMKKEGLEYKSYDCLKPAVDLFNGEIES